MDDDGNKNLNFEEFYKGLVETGCDLSQPDAQAVFRKFDRDGNGSVNVNEFLMGIRVRSRLHFLSIDITTNCL